jgi:micrococcal nuclease
MYEYQAYPTYVVDGDTVDLQVDLGFHVHIRARFRLRGINTPERGEPGYAEAKQFVADSIMFPIPQLLVIETKLDAADKYGRMLAQIFYGQNRWLNQELIEAGHAVPYMVGAHGELES